jgi:hypothetical protein
MLGTLWGHLGIPFLLMQELTACPTTIDRGLFPPLVGRIKLRVSKG